MSPINGVDNHAAFFPINQDNNIPNNINAGNNDSSSTTAAGNQSNFQMTLKSLLDNMMSIRSNSLGHNDPNSAVNSLSSITGENNRTSMLLSLLDQKEQSDMLSQSPGQSNSLRLLQSLLDVAKDENKSNTGQISNIPYSQMITKYKQAMNDFRNAFNLPPTGTPEELNVNTINQIINEDAGVVQSLSGAGTPGVNLTKQQVVNYITEQCKRIGIPVQLGLATAATESDLTQFNKDGTPLRGSNPDSTDWGIMQVNDKAWGDTYDFNLIKSDWKYNVRAGLQILKHNYDAAARNNEGSKGANSALDNLAQAAYSGYNAGTGNIWRYRTSIDNAPKTGPYDVLSNEGYDIRDIRFWNNYQKLS